MKMYKHVKLFYLLMILRLVESARNKPGTTSHRDLNGGTYNPKSAWILVDRRRRVLPDIDLNKHFQSVETHIWEDIQNYHAPHSQSRMGLSNREEEEGDADSYWSSSGGEEEVESLESTWDRSTKFWDSAKERDRLWDRSDVSAQYWDTSNGDMFEMNRKNKESRLSDSPSYRTEVWREPIALPLEDKRGREDDLREPEEPPSYQLDWFDARKLTGKQTENRFSPPEDQIRLDELDRIYFDQERHTRDRQGQKRRKLYDDAVNDYLVERIDQINRAQSFAKNPEAFMNPEHSKSKVEMLNHLAEQGPFKTIEYFTSHFKSPFRELLASKMNKEAQMIRDREESRHKQSVGRPGLQEDLSQPNLDQRMRVDLTSRISSPPSESRVPLSTSVSRVPVPGSGSRVPLAAAPSWQRSVARSPTAALVSPANHIGDRITALLSPLTAGDRHISPFRVATRSNGDVNASAVALLSFLLLLNMMQDVMERITGGRRR